LIDQFYVSLEVRDFFTFVDIKEDPPLFFNAFTRDQKAVLDLTLRVRYNF
jgi:hypothetical protein